MKSYAMIAAAMLALGLGLGQPRPAHAGIDECGSTLVRIKLLWTLNGSSEAVAGYVAQRTGTAYSTSGPGASNSDSFDLDSNFTLNGQPMSTWVCWLEVPYSYTQYPYGTFQYYYSVKITHVENSSTVVDEGPDYVGSVIATTSTTSCTTHSTFSHDPQLPEQLTIRVSGHVNVSPNFAVPPSNPDEVYMYEVVRKSDSQFVASGYLELESTTPTVCPNNSNYSDFFFSAEEELPRGTYKVYIMEADGPGFWLHDDIVLPATVTRHDNL